MIGRAEEVLARRSGALVQTETDKEDIEQAFNASDPKAVKEQEKKNKHRKEASDRVLENLLSTVAGRSWLSDILVFCDTMGNPFVPDSHSSYFNGGMANVGKMILNQIFEVAPEKYGLMLREARKRVEE